MNAGPVLIVGERTRERLKPALGSRRFRWLFAADLHTALERLAVEPECQVVVAEFAEAGKTLLEKLPSGRPEAALVLVTGGCAVQDAAAAFRDGAVDLLVEPFERDEVLAALVRAQEQSRERVLSANYRRTMEHIVRYRTGRLRETMLELERSYDVTLEAMGDALDLRDEETEGHSKRVTAYTIALARAMRLGSQELKVIARGAFLHDIGKIAIPDAILLKPGRLTDEEMMIMQTHCERGYRMIRKIPFLEDAAEIVYTHQEKFNGSGYPRGLRGEEIPLGARIFALADTLDAMTSDRPYRRSMPFTVAAGEIERCRGSQFDPKIVDVFLRLPVETWIAIRSEVGRGLHASELVRKAAA